MPTCGKCSQACNCILSPDGFYYGGWELGRQTTEVSGSGTTDDPYKIDFFDQLDFYPRTLEYKFNDLTFTGDILDPYSLGPTHVINATGGEGDLEYLAEQNDGSSLYESPIKFLIRIYNLDTFYPSVLMGDHFLIGASVTFAETADSVNNFKQLVIVSSLADIGYYDPDFPSALQQKVIAGHSVPGGGGDPITLSAVGRTPISFYKYPGSPYIHHAFTVYVNQNSGALVYVTDMRIWVTQI